MSYPLAVEIFYFLIIVYNVKFISKGIFEMNAKKYELTKTGLAELERELKQRKTVTKRKLQDQLDNELDEGDISENTNYYRIQEDIGMNDKRIQEIQNIIYNSTIVGTESEDTNNIVDVGNTVTLAGNGKTINLTIVGATEADPSEKKISLESPMGKELLGKKKGETITVKTPSGSTEYKIDEIV